MLFNINRAIYGFSLIELSIVLIIIGLLIAGVTGGASLIQSAKIMSHAREFMNYKQAVFIFIAKTNKLPGDHNNDGKIRDEVYTSSFPAPYNAAPRIPDMASGPWVDLYLEGVTDFQPTGNTGANIRITATNGGAPISKPFPAMFFAFLHYQNEPSTHYGYRLNNNVLFTQSFVDEEAITAKNIQTLDKKIDDGIHNTGLIRGLCYNSCYL